jgi:hypothetical protein
MELVIPEELLAEHRVSDGLPHSGRKPAPVLREADQGNAAEGPEATWRHRGRWPDRVPDRSQMLCEQRLQSFVQKRGIGIWDYRQITAKAREAASIGSSENGGRGVKPGGPGTALLDGFLW